MTEDRVLLLRTCSAGGLSRSGYRWPLEVGAECVPDEWDPRPICGGGLHGLPWGEGDVTQLDRCAPVWIVFSAEVADLVMIGDKAKVRRARIEYVGGREAATWLAVGSPGHAVHYASICVGHRGVAIVGDRGVAQAGYGGVAQAGYGGRAAVGDHGSATAGHYGHATAGEAGRSQAGDYGVAQAGRHGHAQAGTVGRAEAGLGGTVAAGRGSVLVLERILDRRWRLEAACVGDGELAADVAYRLDGDGRFVRAEEVT